MGGSEISRLGVRLKDRGSGVETQRHRDMKGRLGDTENQMGRLRTIGTCRETQIYRLGGGTHTQNYRESEGEPQSYTDLGVEIQRYGDLERFSEIERLRYRDSGGENQTKTWG